MEWILGGVPSELLCPICFEAFDDSSRVPRLLNCGHRYDVRNLSDQRTSLHSSNLVSPVFARPAS